MDVIGADPLAEVHRVVREQLRLCRKQNRAFKRNLDAFPGDEELLAATDNPNIALSSEVPPKDGLL
ncbi:MAG: hypothetical protein H8E44_08525, partial [Planctomycetes bacterium]|nr:hypothetical protein [Planctomycetota bacterium]